MHKKQMYAYNDSFNNFICRLVSLPILLRLIELSINKAMLVRIMNERGFRYTYGGLCSALNGHNFRAINMEYFSKIYYVLEIPLPSAEELLNIYIKTSGKVLLKKRTIKTIK